MERQKVTYVQCTHCSDMFMLVGKTPIQLAHVPGYAVPSKNGKCPKH